MWPTDACDPASVSVGAMVPIGDIVGAVEIPRESDVGAAVVPNMSGDGVGTSLPNIPPLESAEGEGVGTPVVSTTDPAIVGAMVWPTMVGAMEKSREPVLGAGVKFGTRGATVGDSVYVPFFIMQGAETPSSHSTPVSRIVLEQQSDAPLVPAIDPHPSPPH